MNDKKHIDRLFQEKLKDFEVKPNDEIWANIERRLEKPKRKRRVIPIWLRYGSIAATLLLFLALGNYFFNDTTTNNNVVDTKTEDNVRSNNLNNENENTIHKEKENIEDVVENTTNNTSISNTSNTDSKSTESNLLSNKDASKALKNKAKKNQHSTYSSKNTYVAATSNNENAISNRNKQNANNNYNATDVVASNKISKNESVSNAQNSEALYAQSTKENSKENDIIENTDSKTTIASSNETKIDKTHPKTPQVLNKDNTISNTDIATTNNGKEKEKNITKEQATTSESIEEAIAKIEDLDTKEKEDKIDRWTVNANIAPVYYNTLGKGSHIHDQFIDNPKSGEVNTSYGIKVGYALNEKIKVRSGLNKLDLSYDTANVIIYDNVSRDPSRPSSLRNIDFIPDSEGQLFSILSRDNLGVQQVSSLIGDNLNAALSQRMSYIEVPLELEYALVETKLGVNVIGGASAFFLNDNEVVSEIDNRKTKIGEANNINEVSYSANIGLGIDYKFSDKLKFNLEPTFKYQMNAYSETSGDFRPYIIGVYTGFSYKF